jgi:hypothetical protein
MRLRSLNLIMRILNLLCVLGMPSRESILATRIVGRHTTTRLFWLAGFVCWLRKRRERKDRLQLWTGAVCVSLQGHQEVLRGQATRQESLQGLSNGSLRITLEAQ